MKKEEIKRMNDLYHLSQERDLSEEEFAEWEGLKSSMSPISRRALQPSSTIHM